MPKGQARAINAKDKKYKNIQKNNREVRAGTSNRGENTLKNMDIMGRGGTDGVAGRYGKPTGERIKTARMEKSKKAAPKDNSRKRPGEKKTTQKNMTGRRRPGGK